MADDGSVVLAGRTSGNWSGTNAGSVDMAAVKLDAEGDIVWKWQVNQLVSRASFWSRCTSYIFCYLPGCTAVGALLLCLVCTRTLK